MKDLKKIKELRDILIKNLTDEQYILTSSEDAYLDSIQKLCNSLLEIKKESKIIKQFSGDYRWLSNFWNSEIVHKGIKYPTNEHFYQAMKTKDLDLRIKFSELGSPAEAKKLSHEIKVRDDWDETKLKVMEFGLRQKFNHTHLKKKLIDTGSVDIYEGNTWNDRFWGVDLGTLEGENNLGKLIMKIRSELN